MTTPRSSREFQRVNTDTIIYSFYSSVKHLVGIRLYSNIKVHHLYGKTRQLPEPAPEYLSILGFSPPIENIVTMKLRERIQEAKEYVNLIK